MVSTESELTKKYTIAEVIGTGAYGEVYKATSNLTKELVAIKKVRADSIHEGIPATALREISLLKELDHPNIVKLKDLIIEKRKLYLIFELLDMDLCKYFEKFKGKIEEKHIKIIAYQILLGMKECHNKRILHRDLKPKNILLKVEKDNTNVIAKLADFGLSKAFVVPFRPYTNEVVTLWYRPPEILLGTKDYFTPVDVWSFGCILAEMVLGRPLFAGDSDIDQLHKIFNEFGTPNEEVWPGITLLFNGNKFKEYPSKGMSIFKSCDKKLIDLLSVN
jgi:serine/threonine protein kinase